MDALVTMLIASLERISILINELQVLNNSCILYLLQPRDIFPESY